jgi:hypothetical protein
MNDPLQKSLDDELARLARDIPPPRNLWSGIRARLDGRPRRGRPMVFAAAAGLAGACLASALTWAVLHGRPGLPAPQMAARVAASAAASAAARAAAPTFDEPRTASYVTARDDLELNFRERLARLDPATRAQIESSLAIIRRAHEDITKALASDPASPVLEQLWQSTWHDELDLYDHVVRATQPTLTRT